MNKRLLIPFIFFVIHCIPFSINCMEPFSVIPTTKKIYDRELWVKTLDKTTVYISSDIMQYCNRLKLAHTLYRYGNKNNPLPVKFTQQELADFVAAMTNFKQAIDETQASFVSVPDFLLSVMSVAEKCGAYLLYALCVSHFFHKCGVEQIDKQHIVPFLEAIKSPLVVNIDEQGDQDTIICAPCTVIQQNLVGNGHFFIKCNSSFQYSEVHQKCEVFDSAGAPVFYFEHLPSHGLHLYPDTNVVMFAKGCGEDANFEIFFCDLDAKNLFAKIQGDELVISRNKKYIISQESSNLVIHNCVNPRMIQKKILLNSSNGLFSPDNTFFAFVKKNEASNLSLCVSKIADIDWEKETSEPPYATIHTGKAFCKVLWSIDSTILIFGECFQYAGSCEWQIKRNVLDVTCPLEHVTGQFLERYSMDTTHGVVFLLTHLEEDDSYNIYHISNLTTPLINKKIDSYEYDSSLAYHICIHNEEEKVCLLHYNEDNKKFDTPVVINYPSEFFGMNQKGWFILSQDQLCHIEYMYSDKRFSETDRVYDDQANLLMTVISPKKMRSSVGFSIKSDQVGDIIEIPRGKPHEIPCCYLKPTSFFPDLTLPQMILLMGTRKKGDTFKNVRKNDPVDTILYKFGNKQQEVQARLGIEYQKQ